MKRIIKMLQSLIRGSNKFYCCTIKIPQSPPPPQQKSCASTNLFPTILWFIDKYMLIFGFYVVYTKTIIFTSVSVKVVDIYFHFGNYLLVINVIIIHDVTYNREKCMLITKGYCRTISGQNSFKRDMSHTT